MTKSNLKELEAFEEWYLVKLELPVLQAEISRKMLQHVKTQMKKKNAAVTFHCELDDFKAQGTVRAIFIFSQRLN